MGSNGIACLDLPHRRTLAARAGITIADFIKRYVHKYFCWQILYEIEGPENLDEWPHDELAIFNFYSELLCLKDIERIKSVIQSALQKTKPALTRECVCGSGKQFKRCHWDIYHIVASLGKTRLHQDIEGLNKLASKLS